MANVSTIAEQDPAGAQPDANGGLANLTNQSSRSPQRASSSTPFRAVNSGAQLLNEKASVANAALTGATRQGSGAASTPPSKDAAAIVQVPPSAMQPTSNASTPQLFGAEGSHEDNATYGTRSRNRNGNARPNYAEDQEIDFEFTSAPTTKDYSKKKEPASYSLEQVMAAEFSRSPLIANFFAVNSGSASATASPSAKEPIPGTSSFNVNPSKKRKAAGTATPISQSAPAMNGTASAPARRPPVGVPPSNSAHETNVMTFHRHKAVLNKKGELVADDGTKLAVNNHVYLVCEPPGDPYYLCRIMEFLHVDSDNPSSPVDAVRVNWYYRPRDVQRFNSDSRLLYATMHSDICPILSLRGKCNIKHRSEIEDLDAYRKERDSFYFVQVFDRFIRRWYECIPTRDVINVPERVKKALDERWKFIAVEIGRVKELTSAVKTCKRCARYCASNDSVECAICKNSYHMNCVQPPLKQKPSRGFAWACGPCSRASEKKFEARNTPTLSANATDAEEEEIVEEEEAPALSNDSTRAPSPSADNAVVDDHPATQAEIALAKMWPMRYLGIHCRVEDALQYDDRAIYPRASSRLGPRHQANISMWHGRPVELVKLAEIKKRYLKTNSKKDGKLSKETLVAMEADRAEKATRPKWVQDEPLGYVHRGEDYDNKDPKCTAKLMFRMPPMGENSGRGLEDKQSPLGREKEIDEYMKRAKPISKIIAVPFYGTNFLDKALESLTANNYNQDAALKQLSKMDRHKDLHEPILSKLELTRFEEGVAKFGSEHRLIRLHMKTEIDHWKVVRFYYLWKKTAKGREIWGSYGGRKGTKRKLETDAASRSQAEVVNTGDDSAFDNEKAAKHRREFQCKFCSTAYSRQWRKAPGVAPGQSVPADGKNGTKDKNGRLHLALCLRCAGLWRKYAIQWEDIDEVAKKVAQGGGRAWKRRIDEELLRELVAANEAANNPLPDPAMTGIPATEAMGEPPKKKSKTDSNTMTPVAEPPKKKEKPPPPPKLPTPPPPPIEPAQPVWRMLNCAVCKEIGDTVECEHCKLTVHRRCYGLPENEELRPNGEVKKWVCDQCLNDRNPTVSTEYSCCLCLTEETAIDLVEPPKVSHKKKTEREREKERLERELADAKRAEYKSKQVAQNRPIAPREPLKRTAGNNWVHVYCAVWTPEIKFADAKAMDKAEGMGLVPMSRLEAVCKLCKNKDHQGRVRENAGSCISCHQCHAAFHASCALETGYQFGFDVTPVKGSRKDQITTATLGEESGALAAAVWCKEHAVKSIIHPMNEVADETGTTALQLFVEKYKQADLTLTGTVRKATLVGQLTKSMDKPTIPPVPNANRRVSTANSIAEAVRRGARTSSVAEPKIEEVDGENEMIDMLISSPGRCCVKCNMDVTPMWHLVEKPPTELTPLIGVSTSMSLGELNDMERNRTNQPDRPSTGFDITGQPVIEGQRRPPWEQARQQQNIRFMPPGASGRAWEGMPDRATPRSNGITNTSDRAGDGDGLQMNGSHEPPAQQPNWQYQPQFSSSAPAPPASSAQPMMSPFNDVFHNHALPRYENPALAPTPPRPARLPTPEAEQREYLCHKCFLKKLRDPTPPPPSPPARMSFSPPRSLPLQLGWNGAPRQPIFDNPPSRLRLPWETSDRPLPPPTVNGHVPSPGFASHVPQIPPQQPSYPCAQPPFAQQPPQQQPNGYHGVPVMQSRPMSLDYVSQPPPQAVVHAPPHDHRPPHIGGFPPTSSSIPNGIHSPHAVHQALQSPTYIPGRFQPVLPGESPFLNPILPPLNNAPPAHSSPSVPFSQPSGQHASPAPGYPQQPAQQQTSPARAFSQPQPAAPATNARNASSVVTYSQLANGQHASPATTFSQPANAQHASPVTTFSQPANAQHTSPPISQTRPATPRDSSGNAGASASPSLRNLID